MLQPSQLCMHHPQAASAKTSLQGLLIIIILIMFVKATTGSAVLFRIITIILVNHHTILIPDSPGGEKASLLPNQDTGVRKKEKDALY